MRKKNHLANPLVRKLIRWLLRSPAGWALMAVLLLAGYGLELGFRDKQAFAGVPRAQAWEPGTFARVFRNDGFMVGYSEWRASPLWVSYRLEQVRVPRRYKRPQSFRIDDRSLRRIGHHDFSHSGYDRGHLAPNYAIAQVHGRSAQLDTFLMTNVVPQKANLNQKLWQRLEEVAIDRFTAGPGPLWVMTGPVFDEQPGQLDSGVEIPAAFFKIFLKPSSRPDGEPRTLSFLMPQRVRGDEDLRRFVTSIDTVEQRTGLDFFHKLDDWIEDRIEARSDHSGWGLDAVATLPGRYASRRRP